MKTQEMPSRMTLFAFAITELLLVMPATLFLGLSALRGMQPRRYEPARTSWLIFESIVSHLTPTDAAIIFLVLPSIAFVLGVVTLRTSWQESELLRWDAIAFTAVLRRNVHFLLLSAGAVAGAAILAAAVVHMITD
jgi:hypothetical protein